METQIRIAKNLGSAKYVVYGVGSQMDAHAESMSAALIRAKQMGCTSVKAETRSGADARLVAAFNA